MHFVVEKKQPKKAIDIMKEVALGLGFKIVKKLEFNNGGAVALYELEVFTN